MNLYPAIDILDGKCVRLKEGKFSELSVYANDPLDVAKSMENEGASYLHVVDLSGAKDPNKRQKDLIFQIVRSVGLQIQYGGGIRSFADVNEVLEMGVSRVIIGSLAVLRPEVCANILREFGPERISIAMDVRIGDDGKIQIATHGWQNSADTDYLRWIEFYRAFGLKHILCTDISRDGMLSGPNISLYKKLISDFSDIEFQASGGVADLKDILALKEIDVPSVIVGKALYEGKFTLKEAMQLC